MNKPQPHNRGVSPRMNKLFVPLLFALLTSPVFGQVDTLSKQSIIIEKMEEEKLGLDWSIDCSGDYIHDIMQLQNMTEEEHGDIFPSQRLGLLIHKFERDYCENGKLKDEYIGKRLRLHVDAVERREGELEEVNSRLYFDDEM